MLFNNCDFFPSETQKSGFTPAPDGYGASTEWQEQQAADFADVRQVGQCRLKGGGVNSYI